MGLVYVFEFFLQRPKNVVFEGLVRTVVGNRADWDEKVKRRTRKIRRTKRGRVEFREK